MSLVVAVVGPGNMGAAVARRLTENGVEVLTTLAGRGAASVARAEAAGMTDVPLDGLTRAEIVLSILPPAQAMGFAERMASVLAAAGDGRARSAEHEPVFVDCNAVSPETVRRIGAVVAGAGAPFVDGSIIGLPPKTGQVGPRLYVSGDREGVARVQVLAGYGLDVRVLEGPVGAASALKMSYRGNQQGGCCDRLGDDSGGFARGGRGRRCTRRCRRVCPGCSSRCGGRFLTCCPRRIAGWRRCGRLRRSRARMPPHGRCMKGLRSCLIGFRGMWRGRNARARR